MKKRYNIALVPVDHSQQLIDLSKNFISLANNYLLGEKSLPHLTLCQFFANEVELVSIWEQVSNILDPHVIDLVFTQFSFVSADNYYWVSLRPDSCNELVKMHYTVASVIKNPINRSYEQYDPHITLFNTKDENYEEKVKQIIHAPPTFTDAFVPLLGESDDVGQLLEAKFSNHSDKTIINI